MINFILDLIFLILLGILVYIDFIKISKELYKLKVLKEEVKFLNQENTRIVRDMLDDFNKMNKGVYLVRTSFMNFACFDNKKNAIEYKKMLTGTLGKQDIQIEFFVLRNEFFEENMEDLPFPI